MSNKHDAKVINMLYNSLKQPGKWETHFVNRLYARSIDDEGVPKDFSLQDIERLALDSILHHYRDQLPDGYHFCTRRCQQYERPEAEPWFQAVLFDKEPFEGEPSLMQHPTGVQLTL